MRPILFTLPVPGTGGVPVPAYGAMMMLSFVLGALFATAWGRARGIRPRYFTHLAFAALIGGALGARLLFVIEYSDRYAYLPWWRVLSPWEGGLTFYGGLVGGTALVLATLRLHRLDGREVSDIIAPQVALGLGLTRIGCFLNGCCFGAPCPADHPLAVVYPARSYCFRQQVAAGLVGPSATATTPVYASQLMASVADFALFAVLTVILWKRPHRLRGLTTLALGLLYPVLRFTLECFRADSPRVNGLSSGQYISLVLFAMTALSGIVWGAWVRRPAGTALATPECAVCRP
jgi:phosphatidylglycerol:prolipoprotein diacylglycerol transferase